MLGLLVNQAYEGDYEECKQIIVAIELIHQGSLMQDDVIDGDKMRRDKPTVEQAMGLAQSVAGGQKLVAMGIKAGLNRGPRVLKVVAGALQELIEGNTLDLEGPGWNQNKAIKIAEMKTGCLYGAAAKLGAVMAKCYDMQVDASNAYGRNVGIAFQIADDITDVVKSVAKGEFVGDMSKHKVTLSLIQLYGMSDDAGKAVLDKYKSGQLLTQTERDSLLLSIRDSPVMNLTMDVIAKFLTEARGWIPDTISPDYRKIMQEMPQLFVDKLLAEVEQEKWW
jgi:geranylgeranyl diphosphate synthase type I